MRIIAEKKQILFLALLISGIVGLIYWHVFSLPFISDDWWFLRQIQLSDAGDYLLFLFDPNGKTVYTPLGEALMVLMYEIFGFDPVSMRLPGFLIHVMNSCVVAYITVHVLENKWIGYLSGIVYASALAVHLDIFTWSWATYGDIGATLFFFLSIWLYLKERTWLSAHAYLVGCLFKPTIIFLPALLFLHSLILPGEKKVELHPVRLFYKWFPFIVYGGALTGFKLMGGMPTALGEDAPYYVDFWGKHLVSNGQKYLTWMFQAIIPLNFSRSAAYKTVTNISLLIFLPGLFIALLAIKRDKAFRRMLFLFAWLVIGLLAVYFLPNHTYRYYSIYSLPAFIALFFYVVQYLLTYLKVKQSIVFVILTFLGLFAVTGAIYQSGKIFNEKINQRTFADGSGMLIRRAATVTLVTERIKQDFPDIPLNFVIVLAKTDMGSFGGHFSAFQYLYKSDAFEVITPSSIYSNNGDLYYRSPDSADRYLDPSLVVVYELVDNDIVRLELTDLIDTLVQP